MTGASSAALQKAKVTGFISDWYTLGIYSGSLAWLSLLLLAEAVALQSNMWKNGITFTIASSIAFNSIIFVSQTIDYLYFHFLYWPLTAINWCCQLAGIGTASAILSFAILYTSDTDTDTRRWMALTHLVGQALFTASQFSVTLEYFERRLNQVSSPVLPQSTVTRRATGGRRL